MKNTIYIIILILVLPVYASAQLNFVGLLGNRATAVEGAKSAQVAPSDQPSYEEANEKLSNPAYVACAREDCFRNTLSVVQNKAKEMATTKEQLSALEALKHIDVDVCLALPSYVMDSAGFAYNTGYMVVSHGTPTHYGLRDPLFFLNIPNRLNREGLSKYDRQPGMATYASEAGNGFLAKVHTPAFQMHSHRFMVGSVRNMRISIAKAMLRVVSE